MLVKEPYTEYILRCVFVDACIVGHHWLLLHWNFHVFEPCKIDFLRIMTFALFIQSLSCCNGELWCNHLANHTCIELMNCTSCVGDVYHRYELSTWEQQGACCHYLFWYEIFVIFVVHFWFPNFSCLLACRMCWSSYRSVFFVHCNLYCSGEILTQHAMFINYHIH